MNKDKQSTPMNRADYLLSHLVQEACEFSIRCTKAQMFGLDEVQPEQSLNNAQRIVEEFNDLIAMIEECQRADLLPIMGERDWQARLSAKQRKAKHFRRYSRELGRLEPTT